MPYASSPALGICRYRTDLLGTAQWAERRASSARRGGTPQNQVRKPPLELDKSHGRVLLRLIVTLLYSVREGGAIQLMDALGKGAEQSLDMRAVIRFLKLAKLHVETVLLAGFLKHLAMKLSGVISLDNRGLALTDPRKINA